MEHIRCYISFAYIDKTTHNADYQFWKHRITIRSARNKHRKTYTELYFSKCIIKC